MELTKHPSEAVEAISRFLFSGFRSGKLTAKHDLVIVLGSDYIEGAVDAVEALYKDGIIASDAKIILSGSRGMIDRDNPQTESRRMLIEALNRGMKKELFIEEPEATDTSKNFLFSKEIIFTTLGGFGSFENILVIGKAFLQRRASMYARFLGYPVDNMDYYGLVDKNGLDIGEDCWWKNSSSVERIMKEIERIGSYYVQFGNMSVY